MKQQKAQQATDPRIKVFGIVTVLLIIISAIFVFSGNDDQGEDIVGGIPRLKANETNFDFGNISMKDGLVIHNFVIENEGDGVLKFSKMETSCMCTVVVLDVNGKRSPKFGMASHGTNPRGWSESINPGSSANLEVTFDPNAHGPSATGPITRVVTIQTNDDGNKKTSKRFIFSANVTK